MKNQEIKLLAEYLENCAVQYVAAYPLREHRGIVYRVTVTNGVCLAQQMQDQPALSNDAEILQRALQNTPQSSRFRYFDEFKTLASIRELEYRTMRGYRNVGQLLLYRFARALEAEGVSFIWMNDCFADMARSELRARGVSGKIRRIAAEEWRAMLNALEQRPGFITSRRIQSIIIRRLKKARNRPTAVPELFGADIHPSFYKTYIQRSNKTFEIMKLPFRLSIPPSARIREPGAFSTQIVVIE